MLKLEFTRQEADELKSRLILTEMQERLFEYRLMEYSITKMAMLENVSERTISRELEKIKKKILKVLWRKCGYNVAKIRRELGETEFFFYAII